MPTTLPALHPVSDYAIGSWLRYDATTSPDLYSLVDEPASSPVDTDDFIASPAYTNNNDCKFSLTTMPADFVTMATMDWAVRCKLSHTPPATSPDSHGLQIRVRSTNGLQPYLAAGDAAGAWVDVVALTTSMTTTWTTYTGSFAYVNTSATKTDWDAAKVELRVLFASDGAIDTTPFTEGEPPGPYVGVSLAELTGTYDIETGDITDTAPPFSLVINFPNAPITMENPDGVVKDIGPCECCQPPNPDDCPCYSTLCPATCLPKAGTLNFATFTVDDCVTDILCQPCADLNDCIGLVHAKIVAVFSGLSIPVFRVSDGFNGCLYFGSVTVPSSITYKCCQLLYADGDLVCHCTGTSTISSVIQVNVFCGESGMCLQFYEQPVNPADVPTGPCGDGSAWIACDVLGDTFGLLGCPLGSFNGHALYTTTAGHTCGGTGGALSQVVYNSIFVGAPLLSGVTGCDCRLDPTLNL